VDAVRKEFRDFKGMKRWIYIPPLPLKKVRKCIYRSYKCCHGKVRVFTKEEVINYCKENNYAYSDERRKSE